MSDEIKVTIFESVFTIALTVLGVFLRGIVLAYLWGWFIVPLGVPSIGIATALGISVIVAFLTHNAFIKQEYHPKKTRVAISVFFPTIVFVVGWFYHLFV